MLKDISFDPQGRPKVWITGMQRTESFGQTILKDPGDRTRDKHSNKTVHNS